MATPATTESRTIAKKIIVGVMTAVVTSAVIYMLGFNRSSDKASRIQVKKNTIKAWKDYVKIENDLQPKHDTNFVQMQRHLYTPDEYRRRDSLTSLAFIAELTDLQKTPDIDRELAVLLTDRIAYKKQEMTDFFNYGNRFKALYDTQATVPYKNFLIEELNTNYTTQKNNAVERLGRNIEELSSSLSKKYKYTFSITEFNFNPFYQTLRQNKKSPFGGQEGTLPDQ